jgi:hypothetical protein
MRTRAERRHRPIRIAAGLAAALAATAASAQPRPLGPAFVVNSTTAGWQDYPDVHRWEDGRFVVVWGSDEGPVHQVRGRRFASDGAPQGDDFRVDLDDGADARHPRVAGGRGGGFLVVWEHVTGYPEVDVYARAYDAAGAPYGPPFRVHANIAGRQAEPDVAADAEPGGYLVAWTSAATPRARRFAEDGTARGTAFPLAEPGRAAYEPQLGNRGPGEFVVAYAVPNAATNYANVFARQLTVDGALAGEFQVDGGGAAYGAGWQRLAADPGGGFVVTWADFHFRDYDLFSRWYGPDGAVRAEIAYPDAAGHAVAAPAPDGTMLTLWLDYDWHPTAQLHAPDGRPAGPAFDPATVSPAIAFHEIAFGASSNFVLAGHRSTGEPSYTDVYARRFRAGGVFLDGFEGGGTGRWSSTQP